MTVWTAQHNWGAAEPVSSAFLNKTVQDVDHLHERGDRSMALVAGTNAAIGDLLVDSSSGNDKVIRTTAAGQAGPIWIAMDALTAGGSAGWVRGHGYCNVNVAGSVAAGDFLRASGTAGQAGPTTDYTTAFAQATTSSGGGAGVVTAFVFGGAPGRAVSFATPAITYGTAASAGTATTVIRSDAVFARPGTADLPSFGALAGTVAASTVYSSGTAGGTPLFQTLSTAHIATGGQINKTQLNYTAAVDLASGTAMTANIWYDVGSAQSFTVDDTNSTMEVHCGGFAFYLNSNGVVAELGGRLILDGGTVTTYQFSGGYATASGGGNCFDGNVAVLLTGLSAASHTIKAQVSATQAGNLYCRAASQPQECLLIRVLERKR